MSEPVLEILEQLASAECCTAAWTVCLGKGWYFGHGSHDDSASRFWKMDLEQEPVFATLWEQARERCEQMAGTPLRVLRVYANGHTYGQGGQPHTDDDRPGTYTLLYYPMPEWREDWHGETVFLEGGEILLAVLPRPNRAVFFDARIPHAGRAPSRACSGLRVTVAYKLEAAPLLEKTGACRSFAIDVPAETVAEALDRHLAKFGESLRLPGFRPGKIPAEVLRDRYGAQARSQLLEHLALEAAAAEVPVGEVLGSLRWTGGREGQPLHVEGAATRLAELPDADFSRVTLVESNGDDQRRQALDALAEAFDFPVAPQLVEREFQRIVSLLGEDVSAEERAAAEPELRSIAERRVRLGAVVLETARRRGIRGQGADLEEAVVQALLAEANR